MLYDHQQARDRVSEFVKTCVRPASFEKVCDLDIEVHRCGDQPCSFAEAVDAEYEGAALGFSWGPPWATVWFRMTASVPGDHPQRELHARIDTNTEACVFSTAGVPYHGLGQFHKTVPIDKSFLSDNRVVLVVEAVAHRMLGLHGVRPSYPQEPIGRLKEACLVRRLPEIDLLCQDMSFALQLADDLQQDQPRRRKLIYALNVAVNAINPHDIAGTAREARVLLQPVLGMPAKASAGNCYAVGHAHIDTAWLWPIRDTRRKCYRTFSTALRNMERYPEYCFQQSQAQLYAFVQEDHPALFDELRRRVREGRWDAGGGMWVEPDCNLVSGESLVRQILHGVRYWSKEFGGEQTYLWLPDTFGYGATLPQLLRQAGLNTIFSQKMSWNQYSTFPHHTFWWTGLGGTKVLAHFLTSDTYNSDCSPKQLRYSERAFKQSDRCDSWLYAYGWGDGGGGPTTEMLETLRRAADCEEMPKVQLSTVGEFTRVLHREAAHLPTWDGELYLEYHRGTLTTHAAVKRANRRGELRLRDAEMLHALSPQGLAEYPAARLDACWKLLLLNQFHDILPGSSIGEVYADSARDYARLDTELCELQREGMRAWVEAADTSAADNPIIAINTLGWSRTEVVELPSGTPAGTKSIHAADDDADEVVQDGVNAAGEPICLGLLKDVTPIGHRVFDVNPREVSGNCVPPVCGTENRLENQWIMVELDQAGRLARVFDKRASRELLGEQEKANQFVLYEDRPNNWDAWDIDVFYLEKGQPLDDRAEIELVESGPLRASVRVRRSIGGHSELTQYIRMTCASPRIDFETYVRWNADQELLRVLFPVRLRRLFASYHHQFGHIERPTHFNTSWDLARFESSGHHWCDLSEPDYGVALLSDCKYGYSCHGHVLGLSLLRAPVYPDPGADRGEHRFTYSLLPHPGGLCEGGVVRAGYELNVPLHLAMAEPHTAEREAGSSAMHCDQANIVIDTVKKAEDDDRIVVRLYEASGQHGPTRLHWHPSLGSATPIDILERPSTDMTITHSQPGCLEWLHRPFGIYSVAIG